MPSAQRCYSKVCAYEAMIGGFLIRETQLDCRVDNLPACKDVSNLFQDFMDCQLSFCGLQILISTQSRLLTLSVQKQITLLLINSKSL